MDNKEIEQSAKEKIEKARISQTFLNSKEWEELQQIITRKFKSQMEEWNDKKCPDCESKKFIKTIESVLLDMVGQAEDATNIINRLTPERERQ